MDRPRGSSLSEACRAHACQSLQGLPVQGRAVRGRGCVDHGARVPVLEDGDTGMAAGWQQLRPRSGCAQLAQHVAGRTWG